MDIFIACPKCHIICRLACTTKHGHTFCHDPRCIKNRPGNATLPSPTEESDNCVAFFSHQADVVYRLRLTPETGPKRPEKWPEKFKYTAFGSIPDTWTTTCDMVQILPVSEDIYKHLVLEIIQNGRSNPCKAEATTSFQYLRALSEEKIPFPILPLAGYGGDGPHHGYRPPGFEVPVLPDIKELPATYPWPPTYPAPVFHQPAFSQPTYPGPAYPRPPYPEQVDPQPTYPHPAPPTQSFQPRGARRRNSTAELPRTVHRPRPRSSRRGRSSGETSEEVLQFRKKDSKRRDDDSSSGDDQSFEIIGTVRVNYQTSEDEGRRGSRREPMSRREQKRPESRRARFG